MVIVPQAARTSAHRPDQIVKTTGKVVAQVRCRKVCPQQRDGVQFRCVSGEMLCAQPSALPVNVVALEFAAVGRQPGA